jgi:hypothetical protein
MALTQTQVSELYVAIFGRPSEQGGSQYWSSLPYDITTIANGMLNDGSAVDYFGDSLNSNRAFIEHIYLNTFGRTYEEDPTGIDFWVSKLDEGFSRGFIVNELIAAIKREPDESPALQQFLNRVEISNYYADRVDGSFPEFNFGPDGINVTHDTSSVSDAKNNIDDKEEFINTPDPKAKITLDANITADDIINIAESESTVSITGTVGRDVNEGDEVTLEVNGTLYFGEVQDDDTFSIEVQGSDLIEDSRVKVSVTVTEDGKSDTDKDSEHYEIDLIAPTASFSNIPEGITAGTAVKLEGITTQEEDDQSPDITTIDDQGNFVVTWSGSDGNEYNIYVQHFNYAGQALGSPIELDPNNTVNIKHGYGPKVTAVGDEGNYVVTWHGWDAPSGEWSIFVYHSSFDDLIPVKLEPEDSFGNTVTNSNDLSPEVTAVGTDGAFVVVWQGDNGHGDEIFAQRFDKDGNILYSPILIEGYAVSSAPKVTAVGSDGAFIVTWAADGSAGGKDTTFIQQVNKDGDKVTSYPIELESTPSSAVSSQVQIAALGDDGSYAVTWVGFGVIPLEISVIVDVFDKDGNSIYAVPLILEPGNGFTLINQNPQITNIGPDKAFVVVWSEPERFGGDYRIYVQRFDTNGTPQTLIELEAAQADQDSLPQVTAIGDEGDFVVTWQADDDVTGDESIFAQQIDKDGNLIGTQYKLEAIGQTETSDTHPQITALSDDGSFAIAWEGEESTTVEQTSIFVQSFTKALAITTNDDFVVQSSEVGRAYVIHDSVTVNSLEDITSAADNLWNGMLIPIANTPYNLSAEGLLEGSYSLYTVDEANNLSAPAEDKVNIVASGIDTSIVVFDMVGGVSSDHSGRTFDENETYTIYIRVDSDDINVLNTTPQLGSQGTFGIWTGGSNLSNDDTIVLVGNDAVNGIMGVAGLITSASTGNAYALSWHTSNSSTTTTTTTTTFTTPSGATITKTTTTTIGGGRPPHLHNNGNFGRVSGGLHETIFSGNLSGGSLPQASFQNTLPAGVLTSQGLV